jgi:hypothetical protein
VWARETEGRIFDRRVEVRPPSDGDVLSGPEQLEGWAIDLGSNEIDQMAVSEAERQKPLATAESSIGACGSVETPIWLFATALARLSPKVSIGI